MDHAHDEFISAEWFTHIILFQIPKTPLFTWKMTIGLQCSMYNPESILYSPLATQNLNLLLVISTLNNFVIISTRGKNLISV